MKLRGYLKGRGKLGNMVCAQVAGYTIARDYNPDVANPRTEKQVAQRTAFKLMSQVAAALSPVVAIPREGLVSSRNQFIKKNKDLFIKNNLEAVVDLSQLQLTNGSTLIPEINALRDGGSIMVDLSAEAQNIDSLVWIGYTVTPSGELQYVTSQIVDAQDGDLYFTAHLDIDDTAKLVIYAYGIKNGEGNTSVKYGNYAVQSAEDVAQLFASRSLSKAGYTLTKTKGLVLQSDEESGTSTSGPRYIVSVTPPTNGTVAVTNGGIIPAGSSCKLQATANTGYAFEAFTVGGTRVTQNPYTFTPSGDTEVTCTFTPVVTP